MWSTDPNSTTPEEAVADLVSRQFDVLTDDDNKVTPEIVASDALCIDQNTVDVPNEMQGIGPGYYEGQHEDKSLTITMSRDGKSAWASFFTTLKMGDTKHGEMPNDKRVSDFIVQTPKGWRIAARAWTDSVDNATANKDAKAGKLKAQPLKPEPGDASLNAALRSSRRTARRMSTPGVSNGVVFFIRKVILANLLFDSVNLRLDLAIYLLSGPNDHTYDFSSTVFYRLDMFARLEGE